MNWHITSSDEANRILENGISLVRTAQIQAEKDLLNMKYVKVVGRFHSNNRLKARFTSGGFSEIDSCELWSDPEHPRARMKLAPRLESKQ